MSSTVRAEIVVSVRNEQANQALAQTGKIGAQSMGDLKKGAQGAVQALTGFNLSTLGLVGGLTLLGAGLKYAIDQAAESQRIMAITEAVVKSTGQAAGFTAVEIEKMAGRLSDLNAIDDEVIQSAQNVLLTFKKIKGEAFEQASQAAIDLSVVMGTDLKGAMMMVGKALEDPVRGITALRRAGVSFTAEQQKMIKSLVDTGHAAEAQALILQEIATQVGGAGAKAADTYIGKLESMKNAFGNLAETVGNYTLPALEHAFTSVTNNIRAHEKVQEAMAAGVITQYEYEASLFRLTVAGQYLGETVLAEMNAKLAAQEEALAKDAHALAEVARQQAALTTENLAATGAYDSMIGVAMKVEDAYKNHITPEAINYADATRDIVDATADLIGRQEDWASNAAQDAIQALGALGLEGEAYLRALRAIDLAHGTSFTNDEIKQQKLDAITAAYGAGTLAEAAYIHELRVLSYSTMPAAIAKFEAASLASSGLNQDLGENADKLRMLNGQTVDIYINTHNNTFYQNRYLNDYREAINGGQAAGGPTDTFGMGPRWVGERGPEIWVPPQSGGYILNNQDAKAAVGGKGITFAAGSITINAPGSDAAEISRRIASELRRVAANGIPGTGN